MMKMALMRTDEPSDAPGPEAAALSVGGTSAAPAVFARAAPEVSGAEGGGPEGPEGLVRTSAQAVLDRNRVIEEYAYLINRVAYRMIARLPPNIEVDDLKSAGVIGLIDAAEKYDPVKSTNFRSYAEIRIRGAMLDELRSLDWVPRSVRQRGNHFEQVARELAGRLGRPATDHEVAAELGLEVAEYRAQADRARPAAVLSYEDMGGGTSDKRAFLEAYADPDSETPEEANTQRDRRDLLLRAIQMLGERQRVVLSLYYFEDLNLKEIGSILGVTESRISQIHSKSVRQLRPILDDLLADE